MTRMLMVPMHLDALCLDHNAYGVAPFVSHDRQPYFDEVTCTDVNPDRPFLGAALESPPFSDSLQPLGKGVHLHWALPDGLTKARHRKGATPDGSDDDVEFPLAPNRWLVVRSESEDGVTWSPLSPFWLIESDFISVSKTETNTISYATPLTSTNSVPFRFLGKTNRLRIPTGEAPGEEWTEAAPGNYLPSLKYRFTAVGWRDPSFAAFYPGCYGVFGLYDDKPAMANTRYDVFGWYADNETDPFRVFAKEFDGLDDAELRQFLNLHVRRPGQNRGPAGAMEPNPNRTEYLQPTDPIGAQDFSDAFLLYIQERFGWTVEGIRPGNPLQSKISAGAQFDGTLCYSRVTLNVTDQRMASGSTTQEPVVAIGNTGAEALAAHLALRMEPENIEARRKAEELLLALDLAPMLSGQDVDLGAKFKEARHARGFRTVTSGTEWAIRPAMMADALATAPASAEQKTELPEALAAQLDQLNRVQTELDRINGEIATLRQQLFGDWNRYLEACYPDFREFSINGLDSRRVSRIINLISRDPNNGVLAIDAKLRQRGAVRFVRREDGRWELTGRDQLVPGPDGNLIPTIATRLKAALTAVSSSLDRLNAEREAKKTGTFVLQMGPGPRFYEPNDPVVLLAGDTLVTPSPRHGRDAIIEPGGSLRCQLTDLPDGFTPGRAGFNLAQRLIRLLDGIPNPDQRIGFKKQDRNPWNPLMLEWAALVAARDKDEPGHDFSDYSPNFLAADQKTLLALDVVRVKQTVATSFRPITGRTVLSSHSRDLLLERIENYLENYALTFKRKQPGNAGLQLEAITPEFITEAVNASETDSVVRKLQIALNHIKADRRYLTQSLGGFNQALLMQHPGWQVAVTDPLSIVDPQDFGAFRGFAQAVALQFTDPEPEIGGGGPVNELLRALAFARRLASSWDRTRGLYTPASFYPFHPIRHGQMIIVGLRVIDSFGQATDWSRVKQISAASLDSGLPGRIALTPRLTQPARLNFRWISAGDDTVETNDHPGTTPICGWFLPNHLDESLLVYDGAGTLLGSIDQDGVWRAAPGRDTGPVRPQDIPNPNLARLVTWITTPGNLRKLMGGSRLETALDNILPENFAQHQARALLVGRPMALVRARLNLQLRDAPAASQSTLDFESRLAGNPANQRAFTKVQFPFVIGDHAQFNDGVVAYWEESRKDSSLASEPSLPSIERTILFQSLDDAPTTVSMLVDPRAAVHAFCGVLPAKAISIPPEQFTNVLKALEVNFFVAPVLTEPEKTEVPVSGDPGYTWTWIQHDQNGWTGVPEDAVLSKKAISQAFPEMADTIWNRLQARGWVKRSNDPESAVVLSQIEDNLPSLGSEDLDKIAMDIKRVIEMSTRAIKPVRTHAHFGPRAEIREGWLQLTEEFED